MRLCFLLPRQVIGGGTFFVLEHAKRFRDKGHEVALVYQYGTPQPMTEYPGMEGIPLLTLKEVRQKRQSYDFAVATWWQTAYALPRIDARHYGYLVQGNEADFYPPSLGFMRSLVKKSYRIIPHLFACAAPLQKIVHEYSGRSSTLVPCGVNREEFAEAKPRFPKGDRVRVLVEGNAGWEIKRVPLAFSVVEEVPGIEIFYVSGDGTRNPDWHVDQFFPRVPHSEIPGIFASCDILIKLSRAESFSLPVLEMFATGGTAVVSAFAGHEQFIRNEYNALVVPVDDKAAAAAALKRLVDDPELRERLGEGAKETSHAFSWKSSNDIFEQALQKIQSDPSIQKAPARLSPLDRVLYAISEIVQGLLSLRSLRKSGK